MNSQYFLSLRLTGALACAILVNTASSAEAAGQTDQSTTAQLIADIDTLVLERHARILSDDSLKGRETGSPEARKAAQYIATACAGAGLTPVGPTFLLAVPLSRLPTLSQSRLRITVAGQVAEFVPHDDFIPNFGTRQAFRTFGGQSIFVGSEEDFAVRTDRAGFAGRVAVTLGIPNLATVNDLMQLGVTGMIHLVSDRDFFNGLDEHLGDTRLFLQDSTAESSYASPLPSLILSPQLSSMLYGAVSSGVTARVDFSLGSEFEHVGENNVACVIRGTDPSRGAVTFTAHYDHLGVTTANAAGDSIYNGFSDNAAGVAMLLAIGQAAAKSDRPFGSDLLFLFFTGEEEGLLGSDYFVAHPIVPLDSIQAVINLDAGAPPAPPVTWRVAGGDANLIGELALAVSTEMGWTTTVSPAVANSDYFPFSRRGVPSIFLIPGPGPYEGLSPEESDVLRARWDHYHQLEDEWHPDFPMAGLRRYAEFAYRVARAIDDGDRALAPRQDGY